MFSFTYLLSHIIFFLLLSFVSAFLENNKNFSVISPTKINPDLFGRFTTEDGFFRSLPHVHDMDGFFGAVMRRDV